MWRGSMNPVSLDNRELWKDSTEGDLDGPPPPPPPEAATESVWCSRLYGAAAKEQHQPHGSLALLRRWWRWCAATSAMGGQGWCRGKGLEAEEAEVEEAMAAMALCSVCYRCCVREAEEIIVAA
ncbi:hypothetical protein E2562_003529 [Oryza meyeriana var. granulata]|uniref:Uncharacterized protein n=1 Tax=Oryza meyeriana var. granulata TaxID=110450 RepID=A0A6G1CN97_9ORYZ|nr:hypothetical protein E2562_003529 [Oryza meyeriana var. granulata]